MHRMHILMFSIIISLTLLISLWIAAVLSTDWLEYTLFYGIMLDSTNMRTNNYKPFAQLGHDQNIVHLQ